MGVTRAVCSRAIESNVKVIGEIVSFSKFNSHRVRPAALSAARHVLPAEEEEDDYRGGTAIFLFFLDLVWDPFQSLTCEFKTMAHD